MQWLVQHMIFILLLYKWRISTASSSPLKIAKGNCTSQCGGVSIPYPFGIGPNNHCYFDSWYEIECNLSVPVAKPFLRRLQLEVLNISVYGGNTTVQVPSPVTYLSCKGKQSPLAPNLTGSPFMYSVENSFVAVSCDSFASLRTDTHTLTGCSSTCLDQDILSASEMCKYGFDCCRTALSQFITTTFSITQERDETRRNKTDCEDYAFLVDQQWFDEHKSDFRAIKDRDVVPVKLDWILSLEKISP
ncbi:putative wall-associated receptor kinase [Rosa chinensis]|uniref:Putative wall-associated receptor kinase n=1 Tax=Rosa chinensis TaxID=74649 RepID=A0A2P6RAT5_ROSCH|nr:wall-associated receptor kinase-like 6 [Rosa chinensis]PRQ43545.1 putative wall-associated receptor kinase [Rosa chinensis]